MSPKVLNVEKLEKKFSSLTKSRESIQGLSMWIIRHKEFHREIVNHWLDALTRDLNALTMFYVANDVIQNCGRKRAPEFRDAFSTVLEKAMSLEKVKDIKKEVIRMLTLWNERAIYDDIYFKKLQDLLNTVDEPEIEVLEVPELSEAEAISSFKLEKLINSLRKSKTLEEELLEKQSFLEDIEEPGMSNIDNLIVKMESQKELQKFDKFQKLVEDYLSLSDKVITAKKNSLLNLKYSSIFYNAQLEDAKKVAHAYRIYGKKVKMVEKALSEKLSTFPEQSPVLSEKSPDDEFISSQELIPPSISPKTSESKLDIGNADKKYSPSAEMQISPLAVGNTEKSSDFENMESPSFVDTRKSESKENILKSPGVTDAVKSPNKEIILKSSTVGDTKSGEEKIVKTVTSDKKVKILTADTKVKTLTDDTEVKTLTTDTKVKTLTADTKVKTLTADTKVKTLTADTNVETLTADKKVKTLCDDKKTLETIHLSRETVVKDCSSLESEASLPASKVVEEPDSEKTTKLQTLPDVENIDFLLEKAYDDHHVKSKLSFKRKIDNLLKSKQPKACKLSNDDDNKDIGNVHNCQDKISPELELSENLMQSMSFLVANETNSTENTIKHKLSLKISEKGIDAENTSDAEMTTPNLEKTESFKSDKSIDIVQSDKNSDFDNFKDIPSSTSFPLQTLPDIPTELLKNILDINRINMNISLNADPCLSNNKTNLIAQNMEQSDKNHNNLNDSNSTNDNSSPSKTICSDSKINNGNSKNVCEEALFKDTQDNTSCNKTSILSTDLSSLESAEKKPAVKSTHFLENLQNVLECFTKKEPNIKQLQCSETLNSLLCMPLENSLNIYNCIMQCHSNVDSLNSTTVNPSVSNNVVSGMPANGILNNKRFHSPESKTNSFQETTSVCKDSAFLDKNKTVFHEFSSKDDNLEIMDMEVDSDEDTK